MFEDALINFVESHKHLGLTLSSNVKWPSSNVKWPAHIENTIASVSKLSGIIRAFNTN